MTQFQVGDVVRRLPMHQGAPWPFGNDTVEVSGCNGVDIAVNGGYCGWFKELFEPVGMTTPKVDTPSALGMALTLADLLNADWEADDIYTVYPNLDTARWLREQVRRELLGGGM